MRWDRSAIESSRDQSHILPGRVRLLYLYVLIVSPLGQALNSNLLKYPAYTTCPINHTVCNTISEYEERGARLSTGPPDYLNTIDSNRYSADLEDTGPEPADSRRKRYQLAIA